MIILVTSKQNFYWDMSQKSVVFVGDNYDSGNFEHQNVRLLSNLSMLLREVVRLQA